MGFKNVLQGLLIAACAGVGGGALSIRSTISQIEPLPVEEAYALRNASKLTSSGSPDHPSHRRIYAYRVDGLMPSKHATEQVHSGHLLRKRSSSSSDEDKGNPHDQDGTKTAPQPLAPSLGSLYALHAIESAFPFRTGWMWHTFRDTLRISDTFNVWWRTRPSWMSTMYTTLATTPDVQARELLIREAAEAVEKLSDVRYEALLESDGTHGAVIRGGQQKISITHPSPKAGEPAEVTTTERTHVAPLYGVRFDLPDVPDAEERKHPHPRSAPLYVLYISAPYSSDNPIDRWDRVRMWKDDWYSRWFAAHVVKALSEM
ncbi:hypothetical protein ABB37_05428 [Leptomonas pyrrhocoris]|uniref:Uncharacterized protein n=1 Tax=Leptomonas pyrrhocoris TaxID=157538 RepID=A0A0M9G0G0_LEPPY|nr:hypothetical protein ABB37_05428 [Leptomonas pyrrhocoris]KPA79636.1 hypothetical protein ABB37_05428 [Leptomonas pyrrhocoris]|eukprot:XP_015658075.1 hypothetical protein ABB37_05428 [Leptomonas pyrrhocoris]